MVPVAAGRITRPSIINGSTCTGTVHVTNSATVTNIGPSSSVTTNSQNLRPTLDTVNAQSTKDVPESDLKIDKSATPEKDDPLPVETYPITKSGVINQRYPQINGKCGNQKYCQHGRTCRNNVH